MRALLKFSAIIGIVCAQQHFDPSYGMPSVNRTLPDSEHREGRTFFGDLSFFRPSFFNIVRFPNEECLDASRQSGTCYTALECKKLGGNPSSKCANGLGTCCIMSRTCHNITANKVVYFKNPNYPLTDSGQNFCDLTVNVIDQDICQLRIDFQEFQIDAPVGGDCVGDKFTVTASGMTPTTVPVLCGNNRNQHIYVSLPQKKEERSVSIVFETNSQGDYRWHLKVTQLDCRLRQQNARNPNDPQPNTGSSSTFGSNFGDLSSLTNPFSSVTNIGRQTRNNRQKRNVYSKIPHQITQPAPTGCLQYYTATSGLIESFNFGNYLNNMDYAICIERAPDTCRIIYKANDANFGIEGEVTNTMPGVGDLDCDDDYVLLPGGSQNGEGETHDRYCGGTLSYSKNLYYSTPVVSKANGPIVVRFHSDPNYHTVLKQGFRIKYEQSSTGCAVLNSGSANPDNIINFPGSGNNIPGAGNTPVSVLPLESGKKPQMPILGNGNGNTHNNGNNPFNWDDDGLKSRNTGALIQDRVDVDKPSRSNHSRSRANHKFMLY